ncbi:MAG: CBS domain-containing protein [Thermoplasmata archaeon]
MDLDEESDYVLRRRKELRLTQARLAELAGVSQAYVSRLEKGKLDPRLSTYKRIVAVLEEGRRPRAALREVMSGPVISAAPGQVVSEAVKRMMEHGFSQLPVLRGGVPVGSVSERTIMRTMASSKNPAAVGKRRLEEVMGPAPPSLPPEADVSQALALLEGYPMVLVMEGGAVTGIVTRADILRMIETTSK